MMGQSKSNFLIKYTLYVTVDGYIGENVQCISEDVLTTLLTKRRLSACDIMDGSYFQLSKFYYLK